MSRRQQPRYDDMNIVGRPPYSGSTPPGYYPGPPGPPNTGMYPPTYPGYPQTPNVPNTSHIGEGNFNIDARLDRLEREILEINRRLNALSRRVRHIENVLNIREDT